MGSFLQTLKKLGVVRLVTIAGALAALVAFFVFSASYLAKPNMALLYSSLDLKDSGEVAQKLEAMGVPYEVRGDGSTILAPSDQVAKLRIAMAQTGLPHGASIGYEIFDKPEGLGTTDFVQGINEVRALEGELERTIASINAVDTARVHLVLPKRELFSRDAQEPSASIMLKMRGGTPLEKQQIAAIQNLVASAVPGLKPHRISIVDQSGNLLARGSDDPNQALNGGSTLDEERAAYESRLTQSVEEMLERSLGAGHVRVDLNADMDFDRVTTNAETYDPDGQIVRSTQTVNEQNSESGSGDQPITVQNNLPDGQQTQGSAGSGTQNHNTRTEETTNYEITKKQTTQMHEGGIVKRLSIAVLVDGTYTDGKAGARDYHPRSQQELDQLATLVKSAIGYDQKRGDQVQIVNMKFAEPDDATAGSSGYLMGLTKSELFHGAETLVIALVGLLVMLLVVRPILSRAIDVARENTQETRRALGGPHIAGALTGPGGVPALTGPPDTSLVPVAGVDEAMLDISQIEGRVKASSVKKIGEIVEKHPEEAVSIIRSWMYQTAPQ